VAVIRFFLLASGPLAQPIASSIPFAVASALRVRSLQFRADRALQAGHLVANTFVCQSIERDIPVGMNGAIMKPIECRV
jgi:hypothetical protein